MGKKSKNKKQKKVEDKAVPANRIIVTTLIILFLFICLVSRIGWIQFVDGAELRELASRQQTLNKIITPARGTIYDTNGKALARSAKVDTITINPSKFILKNKEAETKALQEKVAKGLSDIFELEYDAVLAKVCSSNSVETIIKKVEQEKVDELEAWMKESKIQSGINIDEDNKRYYPYGSLAAHVIGFMGEDAGLYGIENKWDSVLKGTQGKIVTTKDVSGEEISDNAEQYVEVEDGSDLYLTIDVNIQRIVEGYLEEGVKQYNATAGSAIVMDPETGDILSMATYPSYDLNDPYTINNEEDKNNWDNLSKEERDNKLFNMWADRNFSRTYEPGSTFKLIVTAAALEEGIAKTDVANDFNCTGSIQVGDRTIKCASSAVHGSQTLRQALGNSCNSAFIQLGQRIGKTTLYRYFKAFGLFERTGIQITGESRSNFHKIEDVGPVELATTSFGQRFDITPLQLITAVSAIANDGVLMQPRIVKEIYDVDTKTKEEVKTNEVRKVISKETAEKIRSMMKYVVTDGGGKFGKVEGYSIGGKTGTSEPSPTKQEEGFTVSFVSVAPIEKPEVVVLVAIYHPVGENPYGSKIAAPIVSKMLSEILPYMGIASENSDTTATTTKATNMLQVPNVQNKTLTEAKKNLENLGFKVVCEETQNSNGVLVKEQVPAYGTNVLSGATVVLYTEENDVRTSVTVPKLVGLTLSEAKDALSEKNLNISYSGSGKVVRQSEQEGSSVEQGTIIKIKLE